MRVISQLNAAAARLVALLHGRLTRPFSITGCDLAVVFVFAFTCFSGDSLRSRTRPSAYTQLAALRGIAIAFHCYRLPSFAVESVWVSYTCGAHRSVA